MISWGGTGLHFRSACGSGLSQGRSAVAAVDKCHDRRVHVAGGNRIAREVAVAVFPAHQVAEFMSPRCLLLLPVATHEVAGTLLALASTLAGNLLIVGSIANIIVVDAAARRGIHIDWKRHARTGVPVTVATLAISWIYLWYRIAPPLA